MKIFYIILIAVLMAGCGPSSVQLTNIARVVEGQTASALPPTITFTATLTPSPETFTPDPLILTFPPDPLSLTYTPETPSAYVPFTFNINLAVTSLTCRDGSTVEHLYNFTYYGPSIILTQLDNGNITSGYYEPTTGVFNTSAISTSSFTATELYAGIITFDGPTIAVTGGTSYALSGQCTITASFAGKTTAP